MGFFFFTILLSLAPFLKKVEERPLLDQVPHIDAIYLINLPERPEKWQKSLAELRPYGIRPCRFPAINGWDLPLQTLNEIGVKMRPGLKGGFWARRPEIGGLTFDFMKESHIGRTYFACWMSPGAIGCTLSHLSILQDALDAGYETIWVLEDDIRVYSDPNLLASLIEKLDALAPDWDVLYTDLDTDPDRSLYHEENDFESDLKGSLWFCWRPDQPSIDEKRLAKRTILSPDFLQIGSRMRTHSMLVRRSGMKKILDFEEQHRLFVPYDHEIALVPNIHLYTLRYPLVTFRDSPSDTKKALVSPWQKCLQDTLKEHSEPEKIAHLMQFVHSVQPQICVEVGALEGAVTYPIARTLQFTGKGLLHAIDAWDKKDPAMEITYQRFLHMLFSHELDAWCTPIRENPLEASQQFADESIDFLYLDCDLEEVKKYLPKVKRGGFIWLNGADRLNRASAVEYLMNTCEWDQPHSFGIQSALFNKR